MPGGISPFPPLQDFVFLLRSGSRQVRSPVLNVSNRLGFVWFVVFFFFPRVVSFKCQEKETFLLYTF